MIEPNITRKIASSCSHSLPVVVSCIDCLNAELLKWEKRIEDNCKRTVADEWRYLEEQLKTARQQTAKLQDTNDTLGRSVTRLESENKALRAAMAASKKQVDEMSAQLLAEQASKRQYPVLVEDAG